MDLLHRIGGSIAVLKGYIELYPLVGTMHGRHRFYYGTVLASEKLFKKIVAEKLVERVNQSTS